MDSEMGKKKQISKELINTWEWLDSFCLTQRGDCNLACGQHAILVVRIDDFEKLRGKMSESDFADLGDKLNDLMATYALEDTIIAKYDTATYVVVLHYLENREEISEICKELQDAINMSCKSWGYGKLNLTVSIGAAECHHDPDEGYKCAARLAMEAMEEAQKKNKKFIVAPDTLRPHPLAEAMKKQD